MSPFSRYDNAEDHCSQLYCSCGAEAKRQTSIKKNNDSQRCSFLPFAKKKRSAMSNSEADACCKTRGTDKNCTFFSTEADDARKGRGKFFVDIPSAPNTPVSRRTTTEMTPTANTATTSRMSFLTGASRASRFSNRSATPTMPRFSTAEIGEGDLASSIVGLLQQDGIVLKSFTELIVRHTIGDWVSKYEAALRNLDDSLAFVLQKLEEEGTDLSCCMMLCMASLPDTEMSNCTTGQNTMV